VIGEFGLLAFQLGVFGGLERVGIVRCWGRGGLDSEMTLAVRCRHLPFHVGGTPAGGSCWFASRF
jgi:hypothetical protein